MKEFLQKVRNWPMSLKIIICIICPLFAVVAFLGSLFEMEEKLGAVSKNPTEETVSDCVEYLSKSLLSFRNHPDNWKKIRNIWYTVNRSNKVTTSTKEKFRDVLIKRGLYLNDKRVINNYDYR